MVSGLASPIRRVPRRALEMQLGLRGSSSDRLHQAHAPLRASAPRRLRQDGRVDNYGVGDFAQQGDAKRTNVSSSSRRSATSDSASGKHMRAARLRSWRQRCPLALSRLAILRVRARIAVFHQRLKRPLDHAQTRRHHRPRRHRKCGVLDRISLGHGHLPS